MSAMAGTLPVVVDATAWRSIGLLQPPVLAFKDAATATFEHVVLPVSISDVTLALSQHQLLRENGALQP